MTTGADDAVSPRKGDAVLPCPPRLPGRFALVHEPASWVRIERSAGASLELTRP
jgi:hypothetical protein